MQTIRLGNVTEPATRLIYGVMRVVHTWNPGEVDAERRSDAVRLLQDAWDIGFTHFDNADIYCHGMCETVHGEALKQTSGMRDGTCITTKCGIRFEDKDAGRPKTFDFSAAWIEQACDASLKRLGIDTIDCYLLHRPDFLMNPAEVAAAFDKLHAAGKVKHFGVSNMSIAQLDALIDACDQPIVCNQIELHPARLGPFEDGELWQLLQRGVTPTAWSPVFRGIFATGGEAPGDAQHPHLQATLDALDDVASRLNTNRTAVTLAWLMRHPSNVCPIVGSTNVEHLREAVAADGIELSREDWYRIMVAARGRQIP